LGIARQNPNRVSRRAKLPEDLSSDKSGRPGDQHVHDLEGAVPDVSLQCHWRFA